MAVLDAPARFVPRSGPTWRDPWPMYEALRDHDPVHHVEDGDYWVLSRFRHVFDAARDTETFSSAEGLTFEYGERERIGLDRDAAPMVMMDPPEHTQFRRLVSKGFTPRNVASLESDIRTFVVERLERLRADGGGDIVAELFKPLPSFVVAGYLGVPEADRGAFDGWTDAIVAANADGNALRAADAVTELLAYFGELAERRRREPADDVVSALVAAEAEADADVSIVQILGFAFTMVAGGNDTVTGLLGTAAELLTTEPDQRERLLEDPTLLPDAVEEFLRLSSPVQGLARTTTREIEIEGATIPAGRKVLLLYGSANRDPREFGDDAEQCDVSREIDRIMTFSYGPHFCLGASAARLQGRVAVDEVLSRFPRFAVDAEAGELASGNYVRRYASLPFSPDGLAS